MGNRSFDDRDEKIAACIAELRSLACAWARQQGLTEPDAEDCAQECILRLLQELGPAPRPERPVRNLDAWLRTTLYHDVRDCVRRLASERRHAGPFPETACEDTSTAGWEVPDTAPTPEEAVHRDACWQAIIAALDQLDTEAHLYFIYHHLIGLSVAEIAGATRQPARHIYHVLERAARGLRKRLEAQGLTAAEVRRSFDAPAPNPPWPIRTEDTDCEDCKDFIAPHGKRRARIALVIEDPQ